MLAFHFVHLFYAFVSCVNVLMKLDDTLIQSEPHAHIDHDVASL